MNSNKIVCDATAHIFAEDHYEEKKSSKDLKILNEISGDQYISMFFLLMDYLKNINFLSLTKLKQPELKSKFCQLYDNDLNEQVLIELFGTMKLYKHLKSLNSCIHVYKLREKEFNKIDKVWKFLYYLCEEITDEDVPKIKNRVRDFDIYQISSAEDFFYYAFEKNVIKKYDLHPLKDIFYDFPRCLNLLNKYEDEPKREYYLIRTPTRFTPCGIAMIYNFKKFYRTSELPEREGSEIDVGALVDLWEAYGFKTRVLTDLTKSELINSFHNVSSEDHSRYDAFVCCILSHGECNSIYTSDGKKMPILELIAPITNECRSLNSKPKLFFIQACQGTRINENSTVTTNCESGFINPQAHDLCIINSALPGYVSYRDKRHGSWFIEILHRVMMSFTKECPIEDVMCNVITELKNKQISVGNQIMGQISPVNYILTKRLVLKRKLI